MTPMLRDEMILVSVDDHVVEPRDLFEHHLSPAWKSRAPRVARKKDGSEIWLFEGQQLPNLALSAVVGRPPTEWGLALSPRSAPPGPSAQGSGSAPTGTAQSVRHPVSPRSWPARPRSRPLFPDP